MDDGVLGAVFGRHMVIPFKNLQNSTMWQILLSHGYATFGGEVILPA